MPRTRTIELERDGHMKLEGRMVVSEITAVCDVHSWRYTLPIGGLMSESAAVESVKREAARHFTAKHDDDVHAGAVARLWTGAPEPKSPAAIAAEARENDIAKARELVNGVLPLFVELSGSVQLSRRPRVLMARNALRDARTLLKGRK